jgi:hypothetical protein
MVTRRGCRVGEKTLLKTEEDYMWPSSQANKQWRVSVECHAHCMNWVENGDQTVNNFLKGWAMKWR